MDSSDIMLQWIKDFLLVFNTPIFELGDSKISLSSVAIATIALFLSFRGAKFVGRFVNRSLEKRSVDSGVRDSLERFAHYLTVTVGVLFSLDVLGFSISSLAAVGAVLMVGVGFGLQNITQNFISGIILLIERPVKVGDIVKVGESTGRVIDIRVRSTVISTRDDVSIILPNSKLISEEVINDSFSGDRIRQHVKVGVAYGSDVQKVKTLLLQEAKKKDVILQEPPPSVIFSDFGESSLDFDLRFWCADLWNIDQVCSDLRFGIDKAFRDNGVEIPFPQRDLHIRSGFKD